MQIRKNVFETNSSSSHSVVISEGTDFITEKFPEVIEIETGEFGWGYDEYSDWYNLASYAFTHAMNDSKKMNMLKNVIKEYTGSDVKFIPGDGYIDEQSFDEAESLFKDEDTLKRFIFGKNSSLIIDNDNNID